MNLSSDGWFLAQSGEVLALCSLFLGLSNCNIGISFHDVVQNIFTVILAGIFVGLIMKTENPLSGNERVDNQYFKVK